MATTFNTVAVIAIEKRTIPYIVDVVVSHQQCFGTYNILYIIRASALCERVSAGHRERENERETFVHI